MWEKTKHSLQVFKIRCPRVHPTPHFKLEDGRRAKKVQAKARPQSHPAVQTLDPVALCLWMHCVVMCALVRALCLQPHGLPPLPCLSFPQQTPHVSVNSSILGSVKRHCYNFITTRSRATHRNSDWPYTARLHGLSFETWAQASMILSPLCSECH